MVKIKKEKPDTFGLTFTPEILDQFKEAIKQAGTEESFKFNGKEWYRPYAEYLAAYVTGLFYAGKTEYKQ